METEISTMSEASPARVRKTTTRALKNRKKRKRKRSDRVKSVVIRFRITPEQERRIRTEYPDVRITLLARRRLLAKRVGHPEHKDLALQALTNLKLTEQALLAIYAVLDPEARAHAFGQHLEREIERTGTTREQLHALFTAL